MKSQTRGFLKLDLQKGKNSSRLCTILHEKETCTIIGGAPWSYSILKENSIIKGFMIDTTFKIMPGYVTSIIMGCIIMRLNNMSIMHIAVRMITFLFYPNQYH